MEFLRMIIPWRDIRREAEVKTIRTLSGTDESLDRDGSAHVNSQRHRFAHHSHRNGKLVCNMEQLFW